MWHGKRYICIMTVAWLRKTLLKSVWQVQTTQFHTIPLSMQLIVDIPLYVLDNIMAKFFSYHSYSYFTSDEEKIMYDLF